MRDPALLAEANANAVRGWPVLPLWWPERGRCACGRPDCSSPGKHPLGELVPHGLEEASTDMATITSWWRTRPRANLGLRTGAASRLVVVDVDGPVGERSLRSLVAHHGRFRAAWARTGSGGWHAYLAHPGATVSNSVGRLGEHLDVRGDGGYVVAPPSLHASGQRYRWHSPLPAPLPPLPTWMLELLAPPPPPPAPPLRLGAGLSHYVISAVEGEAREVAQTPQGKRNDRLYHAARRLGQLAGAGLVSEPSVTAVLLAAAATAGLSEQEARATVRSGLGAGLAHARDFARR